MVQSQTGRSEVATNIRRTHHSREGTSPATSRYFKTHPTGSSFSNSVSVHVLCVGRSEASGSGRSRRPVGTTVADAGCWLGVQCHM